MNRFSFAALSLAAFAATAALPPAAVAAPVWTGLLGTQAAVGGYDSVSYFSGKPVPGSDQFVTVYNGATFKFSNAQNLATFKANPGRYAPQYGGHCAWAAANNYRFAGDPKVWKIVNGKLYLNYNKDVQVKWEKDIPGLISKGDINWVALGK
jgi:YHS domain-containing protein